MITNSSFIPVTPKEGLIGFMNCVYNNDIFLSSIAVKVKDDGTIYLLCPSKKFENKNLQYFYPINSETYNLMLISIKTQVEKFLKGE